MGIFFHFLRKWDIPDPLFSSSFFLSKSLQLMRNMKSPTIKEVKQWANEMFLKGDLKLIHFEKCLMLIPHVNKLFRILETLFPFKTTFCFLLEFTERIQAPKVFSRVVKLKTVHLKVSFIHLKNFSPALRDFFRKIPL